MSFEARRQSVSMDLEFGTLLRILRNGQTIDPYEEMQKLPNLMILVVFKEEIGEIAVYGSCLRALYGFHHHRLLGEMVFILSEDESYLLAVPFEGEIPTVDDAFNVYRYLTDWILVKSKRVPVLISPN
ncbi:MAG: hypothetical protein Q8Q90_02540 [bacterium]|nr:hypothetical protein [bacterium]